MVLPITHIECPQNARENFLRYPHTHEGTPIEMGARLGFTRNLNLTSEILYCNGPDVLFASTARYSILSYTSTI